MLLTALALWALGSEPWGLAFYQLIVFAAPGALLGPKLEVIAHHPYVAFRS